jgi:molecular chaperone DnaK
MKIGEAMYRQQAEEKAQAQGGSSGEAPHAGAAQDEKVVDAEFEEVDEKKKRA